MRESSPKGRSVRPRPFLFSPLFTGVCGETVWKIAEGVTSAILCRQEATDRDSLDSSWPLSEPRFGTHSDFPNSFSRHWCENSFGGNSFSWLRGGPPRAMDHFGE